MVAGVYSNDNASQLEATTQFRKLLSIGIVNVLHDCLWIIVHAIAHIFCVFLQNEVHQLRKLYNLGSCRALWSS